MHKYETDLVKMVIIIYLFIFCCWAVVENIVSEYLNTILY